MKRSLIYFMIVAFTFIFCCSLNSTLKKSIGVVNLNNTDKVNLVIDPGHGGMDAGTIGVDNAKEKVINLDIALRLYDFARVSGYNAFLTRDGDYLVYDENDDKSRSDLYNRMDFINSIPNSTLISIHQNHFDNEKEWGMQIWYSPNDDKSQILAEKILEISKDNLQKENKRENKESDDSYYLLHKAKVPSVMVECGFMSNREENDNLQKDEYQCNLAYSIMLGFSKYICEEN